MREKKFICNIREGKCKDTPYKCTSNADLKRHKRCRHNIDVEWLYCSKLKDDGTVCGFPCKLQANLDTHIDNCHNKDRLLYKCSEILPNGKKCDFTTKYSSVLCGHKATKHDIGVTVHICYELKEDGTPCHEKFKLERKLKEHHKEIHLIGIVWKICTELKPDGTVCNEKFKRPSHLKTHKANKHDINVMWYKCTELSDNGKPCHYESKKSDHVKRHKEFVHDIGAYTCNFCMQNRNSHIPYNDAKGKHHICRTCYNKCTGKESRIEQIASDYLDEHFGTEFLLGSDDSLKKMGATLRYRPDKFYASGDLVLMVEIDEHQHKYNNGSYDCEEKRISDIYDKICGKTLVCIRWNPDVYKLVNGEVKHKRADRLSLLLKTMQTIIKNPPKEKIHNYYMYYDKDNPRLSQEIPKTMIYTEEDVNNLVKPKMIRIKIKK